MKLIVGLGNPGPQYDKTRHNVGFVVVDRLLRRHAPGAVPKARFDSALVEAPVGAERCLFMKPTTFMNRSGQAVAQAVGFYKLAKESDVLVIVDDLALPAGHLRLRPSGSAGGHNGLADIQRALGTESYCRLRIGIDPKPAFMDQADYVLGRFTPEQDALVNPALDKAADATETFVARGIQAAMNAFNTPSATTPTTPAAATKPPPLPAGPPGPPRPPTPS